MFTRSLGYARLSSLALASSVAALVLAAPPLGAQQTNSGGTSSQPAQRPASSASGQLNQGDTKAPPSRLSDLKSVIGTLDQAKDAFTSQPQQAVRQAINALDQAASTVGTLSVAEQAKSQASRSIDQARQVMKRTTVDQQQATTALDQTIKSLRSLERQVAQGSTELTGAQRGGQGTAGSELHGQITVKERAADIQITQPRPEIIVRQPAPDVQVTQPRPEITVQMPEPTVKVQQAQPNVNVERSGEPKVTVQRQGANQQQADTSARPSPPDRPATSATGAATGTQGASATQHGARQTPGDIPGMGRTVVGKAVYGTNGNEIADVEDVIMGPSGRIQSVLMDVGGFLGLGEKRISLPVDQLRMQGDRIITDMTEQQARDLPAYQG